MLLPETTVINMRGAAGRALVTQAQVEGRFVRIDRQTKWGNPFRIGPDGTREDVIAKHRAWIVRQPDLMRRLEQLRGKVLGCWCAPQMCHGSTYIELLEEARHTSLTTLQ